MASAMLQTTTLFQNLGSPEALSALAAEGFAPIVCPRAKAHIHLPPNFTAFDTAAQTVELAAEQDVRVLGVSNYYDSSFYAACAAPAEKLGIFPLFGIEIIARLD